MAAVLEEADAVLLKRRRGGDNVSRVKTGAAAGVGGLLVATGNS